MATALVLFLLGGLVGWLPTELRFALLVVAGIAAVCRDLGIVSVPLPQNARQVPRQVFERGLSLAALQFGVEMGTGARTYTTSSAPYLAALAILLFADSVGVALLAGAGFGIGRALMVATRFASKQGDSWDERLKAKIAWLIPASTTATAWAAVAAAIGVE